jgi:hypothetical protein
MKIRTQEQLVNHVDGDYSWRFTELGALREAVRKAPDGAKKIFIRAGIAILYAHWEGFVKLTAESYLRLIAASDLQASDLHIRFLGLAFKQELSRLLADSTGSAYGKCVNFILENYKKIVPIPFKNVIKTQANLSSTVLKQIMEVVGLDYSAYELKAKIIDGKLLRYRNEIAHGSHLEIDEAGFEDLMTHILGMLNTFKEQVYEAVQNKAFKQK